MELDYYVENFICILTIDNNFAADQGESIIKLVKTALQAKILGLIIDCSKIDNIGNDEIDWIVFIYYSLKKLKLKIGFCHLNNKVYQAIVKKKLDTMIMIYKTKKEAIEALE